MTCTPPLVADTSLATTFTVAPDPSVSVTDVRIELNKQWTYCTETRRVCRAGGTGVGESGAGRGLFL